MRISDWSSDVCSSDLPPKDEPLGRPFSGVAARPADKGQPMLDTEGLEIVDLAPGAALVEQRERFANHAAFGFEGLAAPFGRQALEGDDVEQLCKNGGRDVAADLEDRKSTRLNSSH